MVLFSNKHPVQSNTIHEVQGIGMKFINFDLNLIKFFIEKHVTCTLYIHIMYMDRYQRVYYAT